MRDGTLYWNLLCLFGGQGVPAQKLALFVTAGGRTCSKVCRSITCPYSTSTLGNGLTGEPRFVSSLLPRHHIHPYSQLRHKYLRFKLSGCCIQTGCSVLKPLLIKTSIISCCLAAHVAVARFISLLLLASCRSTTKTWIGSIAYTSFCLLTSTATTCPLCLRWVGTTIGLLTAKMWRHKLVNDWWNMIHVWMYGWNVPISGKDFDKPAVSHRIS